MTKVLSKYPFIILLAVPLVFYISHIYSSPEEESRNATSKVHEQTSLPVRSATQEHKLLFTMEELQKKSHGYVGSAVTVQEQPSLQDSSAIRSEERRVGKECRS